MFCVKVHFLNLFVINLVYLHACWTNPKYAHFHLLLIVIHMNAFPTKEHLLIGMVFVEGKLCGKQVK